MDCPVCLEPKPDWVEDRRAGHCVCPDCGCVLGQVLDDGPEWRSFEGEASRGRVGGAYDTRFSDGGLVTLAPPGLRRSCARRPTQDRRKQRLLGACRGFAARLQLSERVREAACGLLARQQTTEQVREAAPLCAAALYLACRSEGAPRSAREVALACTVPKRRLTQALTRLRAALTPVCEACAGSLRLCSEPAEFRWFDNSRSSGLVCRRHSGPPWVPEGVPLAALGRDDTFSAPYSLARLCERICGEVRLPFRFARVLLRAVEAVRSGPLPVFSERDVSGAAQFREEDGALVRVADGSVMRAAVHGGQLPGDPHAVHVPEAFADNVARFPGFNMVNRAAQSHEQETLVRACAFGLGLRSGRSPSAEVFAGVALSTKTLLAALQTAECMGGYRRVLREELPAEEPG